MTVLASYAHLRSRLQLALAVNAVIIAAEFIGGWMQNSTGLMGDASHNLVDQGSLFLALYAHILTARPASGKRTFGYHRAGMLAQAYPERALTHKDLLEVVNMLRHSPVMEDE